MQLLHRISWPCHTNISQSLEIGLVTTASHKSTIFLIAASFGWVFGIRPTVNGNCWLTVRDCCCAGSGYSAPSLTVVPQTSFGYGGFGYGGYHGEPTMGAPVVQSSASRPLPPPPPSPRVRARDAPTTISVISFDLNTGWCLCVSPRST